jgi:DNA-binding response OmpR family regulator
MHENVLIVDDDLDLAMAVQMALEASGYSTTLAANGREALDAVRENMPSLIILDMMMPVMNGWEFAREFNAKYGRAAPILVLTAAENAKARAAEIDADGVIAKPFDTRKLLAAVRSVAEQHDAHA